MILKVHTAKIHNTLQIFYMYVSSLERKLYIHVLLRLHTSPMQLKRMGEHRATFMVHQIF